MGRRQFYDEVVYFGSANDLSTDGKAKLINKFSMVDRYQYDQQRAGFYYNSDPDCRS